MPDPAGRHPGYTAAGGSAVAGVEAGDGRDGGRALEWEVTMSWGDVYLTCFVIGFALSFVSFLLGSFHLHLPHMHFHGGAHVHFDLTHGTPTAMHPAPGHAHGASEQLSLFNFGTVAAFLAWFGGTGYLLTRYSGMWIGFVLMISAVVGFIGASIIFFF